ncbi:MAG: hypothetical protein IJJ23_03480 [Clostridia bacterium]|nr:hypothetical protein [Clostridia bacterium]
MRIEKLTVNGRRYVSLCDLDHMRHGLVKDIYDRYEKGEDGHIHMTPEDIGAVGAYSHLMVELLGTELREAREASKTADELRRNYDEVYERIRSEWRNSSYVIEGEDENGKFWFRKYCPYVPKDDKDVKTDDEHDDTPVFSTLKRDAMWWHDCYDAECACRELKARTGIESLKVVPAWRVFTDGKAEERLLKAIFGEDKKPVPSDRWCIFLEPEYDGEGMRFSGWLTYHEMLPKATRAQCERLGMKIGDEKPMFTPDGQVWTFGSREEAEKEKAKIAENEPDLAGRLGVMV